MTLTTFEKLVEFRNVLRIPTLPFYSVVPKRRRSIWMWGNAGSFKSLRYVCAVFLSSRLSSPNLKKSQGSAYTEEALGSLKIYAYVR